MRSLHKLLLSLALCGGVIPRLATAYALNEVANHTVKCGGHTIRFGPDARIASFDGMRTEVSWDDEGVTAEIGTYRLQIEDDGHFELAAEPCTFVP